jgi:hypothetical protein
MQWKHSLHALAVRDATHGESFIQTAALTTDHNARKDLDSFLVAFYHSRMYTHAVANRKRRDFTFLLLFLNNINDLVHKLVASARGCGAHTFLRRERFCNSKSASLRAEAQARGRAENL